MQKLFLKPLPGAALGEPLKRTAAFIPILLFLALSSLTATAAPFDEEPVFKGAMEFLDPHRFLVVISVSPCPDGTFWLMGKDMCPPVGKDYWQTPRPFGRPIFVRRLDSRGRKIGSDIRLDHTLSEMMRAFPMGVDRSGNLLVLCGLGWQDTGVLVKVAPGGVTGTRELEPFERREHAAFDPAGEMHIFGPKDYTLVSVVADRPRIVRNVKFETQLDEGVGVPPFLRWWGLQGTGYLPESSQRLLMAAYQKPGDTGFISVDRMDMTTMSVLASGRLLPTQDAYRLIRGAGVPRITMVQADSGGYWMFSPDWKGDSVPKTVVYRLTSDLATVQPSQVESTDVASFSDAPKDAEVYIACPQMPWKSESDSISFSTTVKLRMDFFGYGHDGQLFFARKDSSLPIRVTQ